MILKKEANRRKRRTQKTTHHPIFLMDFFFFYHMKISIYQTINSYVSISCNCMLTSRLLSHLFQTVELQFQIAKAFVGVSLNYKCTSPFTVSCTLFWLICRSGWSILQLLYSVGLFVCLFAYYYNNKNKMVLHIVEFSFANPFIFKEQCFIPKLINDFHLGPTLPFRPIFRTCFYSEVFPVENLQV